MTRERIEDFREIVLPFLSRILLKTNYENMGKSDAEEFARDFNEILELAIKALEQEPTPKYDVTENCIVCKYDETEDENGDHCKKCLAGDSQFEPDDAFIDDFHADDIPTITITIEEYMKLRECEDKCKAGVEPTTKNNLGVDCIKKSDAINIIQDMHGLARADVISDAVNRIIELPPVTPQKSRWIPVSERLPEAEYGESDSVLVCFETETQDVLYFNGGNWCYPTGETYISVNHKNGWHNKVIAWMPLPQPYREVEE